MSHSNSANANIMFVIEEQLKFWLIFLLRNPCGPCRSSPGPNSETRLQEEVLVHVQWQHSSRLHLPHERAEPQVSHSSPHLHLLVFLSFLTFLLRVSGVGASSAWPQRRDGLPEHERPLRLGQEAHDPPDAPAAAAHSHRHHLRLPVQRGQQLRGCHQRAETGLSPGDGGKVVWLGGLVNAAAAESVLVCILLLPLSKRPCLCLQTIRGAGHYVYADQPDDFNRRVLLACEDVDWNRWTCWPLDWNMEARNLRPSGTERTEGSGRCVFLSFIPSRWCLDRWKQTLGFDALIDWRSDGGSVAAVSSSLLFFCFNHIVSPAAKTGCFSCRSLKYSYLIQF